MHVQQTVGVQRGAGVVCEANLHRVRVRRTREPRHQALQARTVLSGVLVW